VPILGADISHYQGATGMPVAKWDQLKEQGVRFVGIRATIGRGRDSAYTANVQRATARDIIPTAYHYLLPGNAGAQAEAFAGAIGTTPAWLDVEQTGVTKADVVQFAKAFRKARPKGFLGVYSSAYKWRALTGNMDATELFDGCWNALWTERGTRTVADLPANEPKPRWGGFGDSLFWQFGPLHLKHGIVDGDAFYGSQADLLAALDIIEPTPLKERPNYRKGYNATVDAMLQAALAAPIPANTAAAWLAGSSDARKDVADALDGLDLGDPAA